MLRTNTAFGAVIEVVVVVFAMVDVVAVFSAVVVITEVEPVVVVAIAGDSVCSRFVRKTLRRQVLPQNCDGSPEHG